MDSQALPQPSQDTGGGLKKTLKIGKITVDRNLCIGAASCVAILPGVFELDAENKAIILKADGTADSGPVEYGVLRDKADHDMLFLAAQSCPTRAIILHDEEGNQIYP